MDLMCSRCVPASKRCFDGKLHSTLLLSEGLIIQSKRLSNAYNAPVGRNPAGLLHPECKSVRYTLCKLTSVK
jgi:hypothetical protein